MRCGNCVSDILAACWRAARARRRLLTGSRSRRGSRRPTHPDGRADQHRRIEGRRRSRPTCVRIPISPPASTSSTPFTGNPYRPFDLRVSARSSFDYLHERAAQARVAAAKARSRPPPSPISQQEDLERTLLFNLRTRVRADAAGQGAAGDCQDNLRLLRQGTGDQPRPPQAPATSRSVDLDRIVLAARAVRIGSANGAGEPAHRQNHHADAAQRPHAGRSIRRDGPFRFRRAAAAAGGSFASAWR